MLQHPEPGETKYRACDDAANRKQTDYTLDANKQRSRSALQTARHAKCLRTAAPETKSNIESGCEHWQNYKHSLDPADGAACIVILWHVVLQKPMFVLYYSLMFGVSLAVPSFKHWSKLAEATTRRIGAFVISLYFDDTLISDWHTNRGSAQQTANKMMDTLGSPFSPEKNG